MNKNTKFSGKPVLSQVLDFIPKDLVYRTAKELNADRYYKKFTTHDHLITMLYGMLSGCTSLRELSTGLLGCGGKISHLGINYFPKRSTLSDANQRRSEHVFEKIYTRLYQHHRSTLSDSQTQSADSNVFIVDSTTISLFGSVLKGVGRNPITGKKKGGIKAHTTINSSEDVPCLVKLTAATVHDSTYLKQLHLPAHSWIVFDKGYTDYSQYHQLTQANINFVTRERDNASYKSIKEYELTNQNSDAVLKDEKILVAKNSKELIMLRRVVYWDNEKSRLMIFITNNHDESPDTIAHLYKKRWQIELLFKRLKQNFPLKYFLGDSVNAIKIQVWVCLIAQLIMKVIQKIAQKQWAYSNMVSLIKFHLFSYIRLFVFLKNPNQEYSIITSKSNQTEIIFSG